MCIVGVRQQFTFSGQRHVTKVCVSSMTKCNTFSNDMVGQETSLWGGIVGLLCIYISKFDLGVSVLLQEILKQHT